MQGLYVLATHFADTVLENTPCTPVYEHDPDGWMSARITRCRPDGSSLSRSLRPEEIRKPAPQTDKCLPTKASVDLASLFAAAGSQEKEAVLTFMQYCQWGVMKLQPAGDDALDAEQKSDDVMAAAEEEHPPLTNAVLPVPAGSPPQELPGPEHGVPGDGTIAQAVANARRSRRLQGSTEVEPEDWLQDSGPGGANQADELTSDDEGPLEDDDGQVDGQAAEGGTTRITRIQLQYILVFEAFVVRRTRTHSAISTW